MRYGPWKLRIEKQRGRKVHTLRRWYQEDGMARKYVRYPIPDALRGDMPALDALEVRLNSADEYKAQGAKKRITVQHAYIDDALIERYERWRDKRTGGSERIPTEIKYLNDYVLHFFVSVKNLPNPKDWRAEETQDAWWEWLSERLAPATRMDIIGTANRFIAWLREQRGVAELPEFKLSPISFKVYGRELENWRISKEDTARTSIPDEHWKVILKAAEQAGILAHVKLGYFFGLRRSEILGVKPQDAQEKMLLISRTLKGLNPPQFATTKSGKARKIPYWFATQEEAAVWIAEVAQNRMDPDTLTKLWSGMELALPRSYSLHDLRHTFITKAANQFNILKVQKAAGHSDIRTTMGYVHDEDEAA
jgi:integrase